MNKFGATSCFIPAVCVLFLLSCKTARTYKTSVTSDSSYSSSYDARTLAVDSNLVLMPYNRFIDPAGSVIRFGNSNTENHSLDCVILPNQNVLAVEDRFGVAFIDIQNK